MSHPAMTFRRLGRIFGSFGASHIEPNLPGGIGLTIGDTGVSETFLSLCEPTLGTF